MNETLRMGEDHGKGQAGAMSVVSGSRCSGEVGSRPSLPGWECAWRVHWGGEPLQVHVLLVEALE